MLPTHSNTASPGPTQPPTLVRLQNASKTFQNGTLALQGVDLAIRPGEFLSLLGPSGCGKSTALRLLAGLTTPTTGTVEWAPQPTKLGFVFQEPTLMPWRTIEANIRLPLQMQAMPRAQSAPKVAEALAQVGLSGFERAYPRQLSGGMKMRASIARALVTRPGLLLMDEPFAALDEITRARLNDDMLRLWEQTGLTIVFVTHSVFESVYLSTRIVVMAPRPGRIVADLDVAPPIGRTETYRTTEAYAQDCRTVSAALKSAMTHA